MQEAAISLDGPDLGTMYLADFRLFLVINDVLKVLSFSPQPSLNKWRTSVSNSFPFNKQLKEFLHKFNVFNLFNTLRK